MLCSEYSLVKSEKHLQTVIPLRCRCWHCDECRPLRTAQLIAKAKAGSPTLFITLTSKRRPGLTADEAAVQIAHAWRTIRAEYLRKHGKGSLPFLAVFEATKRGWPHIHIVACCEWLSQKWLSERMAALASSPIVDVRRVHNQSKIAAYISKYIGKNPHRFKGVKRYWASRDFGWEKTAWYKLLKEMAPKWEVVRIAWRLYAYMSEHPSVTVEYGRNQALIRPRAPP